MTRTPKPRRLLLGAVAAVFFGFAAALLLAALVSQALASHPRGARCSAFVRVNQVGYVPGGAKRAVLLGSAPACAGSFEVVDSRGHVRLRGRTGGRLPAWSSSFPNAYPIDFGRLRAPGTYRIRAGRARSPRFRIAERAALFAPLTGATHLFFAAQRDGPDVDPSVLSRRPSHLSDSSASVYTAPSSAGALSAGRIQPVGRTADVSGGWFDAGDYLKILETGSFADALVALAARDHADAAPLAADARFETDWLLKLWDPSTRTLLYQVGIGDGDGSHVLGDHDVWRLPQADDALNVAPGDPRYYLHHRPAFQEGAPGSPISPNLAGRLAADFGLCAQLYASVDPAYASRCLAAAQGVFDQARTTGGRLTTAAPYSYYPETEWRDDMELGATEIYAAMARGFVPAGLPHSNPAYYLHAAAHWANAYLRGPNADADSLNLYDVSGLADSELAAAIGYAATHGQVDPTELEVSQSELLGDLHSQLEAGRRQAARNAFGAANPFGASDSVPHALGYAIEARRYDAATGHARYDAFATHQLDWVLGANAWGSSFVVGAGSTFPHCLQHQVANLAGSLTGRGSLLLGAAVDGPTDRSSLTSLAIPDGARRCPARGDRFSRFDSRSAGYVDSVAASDSSEPGIDYTSLAALAFADASDPAGAKATFMRP